MASLDEPAFNDVDCDVTLNDLIASDSPQATEMFFNIQVRGLLNKLSERESKVILLRFWEDKTLDETGSIIGASKERVRQIETKAIRKLRWSIYDSSAEGEWQVNIKYRTPRFT